MRVPVGTAVNVTCGPPTAVYCRMSSPSGEVSRRPGQCWTHVKSVGSHHLDAWACWSMTTDSATEIQYTVHLHAYRGTVHEGPAAMAGGSLTRPDTTPARPVILSEIIPWCRFCVFYLGPGTETRPKINGF